MALRAKQRLGLIRQRVGDFSSVGKSVKLHSSVETSSEHLWRILLIDSWRSKCGTEQSVEYGQSLPRAFSLAMRFVTARLGSVSRSQPWKQLLGEEGFQIKLKFGAIEPVPLQATWSRANPGTEQLKRKLWRSLTPSFRIPRDMVVPHILNFSSSPFYLRTSSSGFGKKPPGFRSQGLLYSISRSVGHGWRTYYVDRQGVQHFKRRGPAVWLLGGGGKLSRRTVYVLVVVASGCAYVYFTHLETVPYTHRKHFVLISPEMEKALGEQEFQKVKQQFAAKILPPIHPSSVRVHRVARDVIEAALLGVESEGEVEHIHGPIIGDPGRDMSPWGDKVRREYLEGSGIPSSQMYGDERMDDDDMWVQKSRDKGLELREKGYTDHLRSLKWEVLVVDEPIVNAFCLPGGKIVVFTGILKLTATDAEIATVLAHEVGHVVARHVAEKLTQAIWLGFLQLIILSFFFVPDLVASTSELLLRLPFSRRMEIEADHIGLVLMAAAGFDPRVAPTFYEKIGKMEKVPEVFEYFSTHPTGKTRAQN